MKIIQVNKLYPPHLGGIENVVRDIAEYLAKDKDWRSDVLACQAKGKRSLESINDVKIYRAASFGRLFSLPISFDFFRIFKSVYKDYDLLLIHHPFPLASLARFLFWRRKPPIAVWYHSDIVRQKLFYHIVKPFIYRDLKSAKNIFVSSRGLAENSPLLSEFLDKCQVIPFGIDMPYYELEHSEEVAELKRRYGRFMLAVGRLVYYKGYLDLIEAVRNSKGKLLIIGRGPLEDKMRDMITSYGLSERVIIISESPKDLIPYYQACDFFVFPSSARSEAFGLVQLEAMACSKPVINTNLPTGVPEVSVNGDTGITVPVGSVEDLSTAINYLWEDDDMRMKLGAAARQRIKDNFLQDDFNEKIKKALFIK